MALQAVALPAVPLQATPPVWPSDPAALTHRTGSATPLARALGRLNIPAGPQPDGGHGLSGPEILEALSDLADADPAAAVDPDSGKVLDLHAMPPSVRRAIKRLTVETLWEGHGAEREAVGTTTRVDFADKVKPLELLARLRGMEPQAGRPLPAERPSETGEAIAHRVFEQLGRALLAAPQSVRDAVSQQLGVVLPPVPGVAVPAHEGGYPTRTPEKGPPRVVVPPESPSLPVVPPLRSEV